MRTPASQRIVRTWTLLLITANLLCGCAKPPPPALLLALESQRRAAGLREVDPAWQLDSHSVDQGFIRWLYPWKDGGGVAKGVTFQGTRAVSEDDAYDTGRSFPGLDGTSFETLFLQFDYTSKRCRVWLITDNPKIKPLVPTRATEDGVPLAEAFAMADEVLAQWGRKRLP